MLLAAGASPDGGRAPARGLAPRAHPGAPSVRRAIVNQICRCLNAPERDGVKRILGAAAIDKSEDLHKELTALKHVLDDYREELEAKRRSRVNSKDVGRHCASAHHDRNQGLAARLFIVRKGMWASSQVYGSLGKRYLEDQIRLLCLACRRCRWVVKP